MQDRAELNIIEAPSPNFNERLLPVSMIVLHYTGMRSAEEAIERLRDPDFGVSSHYLVAEDGQIVCETYIGKYESEPWDLQAAVTEP